MKNRHRYSAGWFDTIRPAVLRRDNYKCTVCNATQRSQGYYDAHEQFIICDPLMIRWAAKQKIKIRTIYLQVAHLDQDPSNDSLANLKTFCPRHHLNYDRAFNAARRLAKRSPVNGSALGLSYLPEVKLHPQKISK